MRCFGGVVYRMLENTNAPGFDKILKHDRKQAVWVLAVLLGAAALVASFAVLIQRFLEFPVILETQYNKDTFMFPDVTICHTGPFSEWRSSKSKQKLDGQLTGKQIVYRIKNFWKQWKYKELELNKYTRDDNRHAVLSLQGFAHGYGFGHFPQETFPFVRYRSRMGSFDNFTLTPLPLYLNCFTFSPWSEKDREVKQGGETEGLSLILSDFDRRLIGTEMELMDYTRGFAIAAYEPGTRPDFSHFDALAPAGRHTKVEVTSVVRRFINREEQPCHSHNHDETTIDMCTLDHRGDIVHKRSYEDSLATCYYSMVQKKFVEICGCFSEHFDLECSIAKEGYKACHTVPPTVIEYAFVKANDQVKLQHNNGTVFNYRQVFSDYEMNDMNERVKCHEKVLEELGSVLNGLPTCVKTCTTVKYHAVVSSSVWPEKYMYAKNALYKIMDEHIERVESQNLSIAQRHNYKSRSNKTRSIRERFARLTIFARDAFAFTIVEVPAYPFSALISDFGGMLGLWIGFSVLHIIELLDGLLSGVLEKRQDVSRKPSRQDVSRKPSSQQASDTVTACLNE